MKKKVFVVAISCMVFFCSCGNNIDKNDCIEIPDNSKIITAVETKATTKEAELEEKEEVRQFDELEIVASKVNYEKYSKTYNAESGSLTGKAVVKNEREGFKGKGYVTNISSKTDWQLTFDLPLKQYYNICITVAADESVQNGLAVNGNKISEFTTDGSGKFETISFNNLLLEEGINIISIIPENGIVDVDYGSVTASKDISNLSFNLEDSQLSNKNADYNAKALYNYIVDNYGENVILGQYDTAGTTLETDMIYKTTGKYPAIRFGDLMSVTDQDEEKTKSEIYAAQEWFDKGGIVGYMWHWNAPMGGESCYAGDVEFDLSKAVTKIDIANMDISEIEKLHEDGKISQECLELVKDIDLISEQLAIFRDKGISVIWRPIHEASNGYYWWGCDEASYKWLWKLLYQRQTGYHKLNNLIWVWSAQNANWYVGDEFCDVFSVDIYSDVKNTDGQINSLLFLKEISQKKPIAMSECGNFPDIQNIANEKAMWSYIGQWGGNYILTSDGKLSEEYNTEAELITMYNNNLTITRDKLPDFIHEANILKEIDEKKQQEDSGKAKEKSVNDESSFVEDESSS